MNETSNKTDATASSFNNLISEVKRNWQGGAAALVEFEAACLLSEMLPIGDKTEICRRLSDSMLGGHEAYLPLLDGFIKKGLLEQRGGLWHCAPAMRRLLAKQCFDTGARINKYSSLVTGLIEKQLKPAADAGAKRFAVWGLNDFAETAFNAIAALGLETVFFIDGDPDKRSKPFRGRPVMSLDEALAPGAPRVDAVVICSKSNWPAMAAKLDGRLPHVALFPGPEQPAASASSPMPPVIVTSFPKAGTHLLTSALEHFPGFLREIYPGGFDAICAAATSILPGEVAVTHLGSAPAAFDNFISCGVKTIFILRDPRDVCVSGVQFYLRSPQTALLTWYFRRCIDNDGDRLMAEIIGIPREDAARAVESAGLPDELKRRFLAQGQDVWMERDIAARTRIFTPIMDNADVLTVRFENLVGERGGGTDEAQRTEIERIAAHLGMSLSPAEIDCIIAGAFDTKSPTFRKGLIGDWRNHFAPEHKAAFKRVAGRLLIELGYEKDSDW